MGKIEIVNKTFSKNLGIILSEYEIKIPNKSRPLILPKIPIWIPFKPRILPNETPSTCGKYPNEPKVNGALEIYGRLILNLSFPIKPSYSLTYSFTVGWEARINVFEESSYNNPFPCSSNAFLPRNILLCEYDVR